MRLLPALVVCMPLAALPARSRRVLTAATPRAVAALGVVFVASAFLA